MTYHTGNTPDKMKLFTVGHLGDPCKKSKLERTNNDDVTDEKELCMWGRHIMMGYAYREDATRKDMTEDGWLRTGDLADINREGSHHHRWRREHCTTAHPRRGQEETADYFSSFASWRQTKVLFDLPDPGSGRGS